MRLTINNKEVSKEEWVRFDGKGVRRKYYDNGQLAYEFSIQNKHRHGIYRWYESNGTLRCETIYVYGEERPELLEEEHKLERVLLLGTSEIQVKHEDKDQS
jgi:antitoxin component YwqK of YwqJK toxin-antitoxin module